MSYTEINKGKRLVDPNHPCAIPTVKVEADLVEKFPDLAFPYIAQDHVAGVKSNVHAWCERHQAFTRLSVAGARHRGTKYGCSLCANEHKGGNMPEEVSRRYNARNYIGRVGVQSGIFRAVKAVFPDAVWEHRMENGKEIDVYVPSIRAGIEYNGNYYHSSAVCKDRDYHQLKTLAALKEGDLILHVLSDEAVGDYSNLVHILREIARFNDDNTPAYFGTPKYARITAETAATFHRTYNFRKGGTSYEKAKDHVGMYGFGKKLVGVASVGPNEGHLQIYQMTINDTSYSWKSYEFAKKCRELTYGGRDIILLAALVNPLEMLHYASLPRLYKDVRSLGCIPPTVHYLNDRYELDDSLTKESATALIYDSGTIAMCIP